MQPRFVCVCVGGSIWSTVQDSGTYRTLTKICLHDCICFGGVDVGRGMEFPFHVLYLTCFVEVGLLLFLTYRGVCMYKGKRKFQTVYVDNKTGIEFFYICV